LFIFYPLFEDHFFVFKEVYSQNSVKNWEGMSKVEIFGKIKVSSQQSKYLNKISILSILFFKAQLTLKKVGIFLKIWFYETNF
jgi:hypothetical protein